MISLRKWSEKTLVDYVEAKISKFKWIYSFAGQNILLSIARTRIIVKLYKYLLVENYIEITK